MNKEGEASSFIDEVELAAIAEQLHQRYYRLIYYFLRIFCIPNDCHDDVFNQIFVKIMHGLSHLKHRDNLKSWVVTIAKREIIKFQDRREKELIIFDFSDGTLQRVDDLSNPYQKNKTPERLLMIKQLGAAYETCVSQLDESLKRPFVLRYRDGMNWQEISDILRIKADTARKRSDKAKSIILAKLRNISGKKKLLIRSS